VENVGTPTKPSPGEHSHSFNLRLAAGVILLFPAIWFSWKTIDGLAARRLIRTDLAEIQHARYGILSADQWRDIVGPMFNAQVDKLNLEGQSKSLRPMVERSLYALLNNIKTQMTSPNAKASGMPGGGNPMIVNMIVGTLRPHVPEYTDVVMAELAKPQTQKSFQDSIRRVLADAVKDTFGNTDMTTYNAILKHYGCSSGAVCEVTLANQVKAADKKLTRYYLTVLASAALGFILLVAGKPTLSRGAVVVLMLFCLAMLVGGVLSPMLEVEVRVTKIDATLLGTPIEFRDQSLYYRSKTVFEVFQTLIQRHLRPALLRTNRLVRLLASDLSKWSMADVMALAIFMSFVAFNGVISSSWDGLRDMPNIQQVLIPTNASKILPGYYLFIGFCVSSILLSKKLEHGIVSSSTSESS
jgi:hypothetical protein